MRRTLLFAGGLFILLVFGFAGKAAWADRMSPPDFNHFKCYEAEAVEPPAPEEDTPIFSGIFTDQFETNKEEDVFTPDLFCNPVSKDGAEFALPRGGLNHLLCYKISSELSETVFVFVENQFNNREIQVIEVEDSELLCLPTRKLGCFTEEGQVGDCDSGES